MKAIFAEEPLRADMVMGLLPGALFGNDIAAAEGVRALRPEPAAARLRLSRLRVPACGWAGWCALEQEESKLCDPVS